MQTRFTHRLFPTGAVVAAFGAALFAQPASAQTQAMSSFNTTAFLAVGDYTEGYTFTLSSAVNVTDLGYFDFANDGLASSHGVAIYNAAGTRLFGATVGPSAVAGLTFQTDPNGTRVDSFRYVSVGAPLLLNAGTYTIGGFSSAADFVGTNATVVTTNAPVTFGSGVFTPGDTTGVGGTAPTITSVGNTGSSSPGPSSNSYFGPSFRFTAADGTVGPEPGTFALLGTGLLSMGGVTLRRRSKKAAK